MDRHVLSVYYQNCRGLRTKLNTLYINILSHNYDIIILTETWLHEGISDRELIDSRYQVFRCDRDRVSTGRLDGGGVLVAVRRELSARPCAPQRTRAVASDAADASPPCPLVDHLLIEINLNNFCFVISAVYMPPNLSSQVYVAHFDLLTSMLLNTDVDQYIAVGDYNLPSLEWRDCGTHSEPVICSNYCLSNKILINFMCILDSLQMNKFKNFKDRILDLLFTNNHDCTTALAPVPLVPPDVNHPPFFALLPFKNSFTPIPTKPRIQINFNKADYSIINNEISNIDWDRLFLNSDAEKAVSSFYENIYQIIKKHIKL